MIPIRFDRDGFEFCFRGRWYTVPTIVTIVIIGSTVSLFALGAFHGPNWIAIPLWILLLLPAFVALLLGVWIGAQEFGPWLTAKWYRPPVGFLVALLLACAEFFGLRWADGDPIIGYFFGSLVAVFCFLALVFGVRSKSK